MEGTTQGGERRPAENDHWPDLPGEHLDEAIFSADTSATLEERARLEFLDEEQRGVAWNA